MIRDLIRYIIFALVMLPVLVVAQDGHYGHGHDAWHEDYYSKLQHNGFSCCNLADCRPTSSRSVGDHYEVMLDGEWVKAPPERIVPKAAPDWGTHICAPKQIGSGVGVIYCVVLPPET